MLLNKPLLLDRLEKMFLLSENWDGFGTVPITKKVYDVSKDMINMIEVDVNMRIYVGVEVDGSLWAEAFRPNVPPLCRVEITVKPEGIIDYYDIREVQILSQGSFLLSHETINEILR